MGIEALCFIPCCSKKNVAGGAGESLPYIWPSSGLERTWLELEKARRGTEHNIEKCSNLTPAISLYKGSFYSSFDDVLARQLIYSGKLRLFIISAGYGVLDAFESTHYYDAEMKGIVARYWRDAGLAGIISDICFHINPKRVYGFFAGSSTWNGSSAMYRYFFTEGVKKALLSGFKPSQAGCFYRESGRGVTAILGSLGRVFSRCLESEMICDDVVKTAKSGFLRDGGISIGFEDLIAGK